MKDSISKRGGEKIGVGERDTRRAEDQFNLVYVTDPREDEHKPPVKAEKAWEEWLTEQKSNTERSIHGNAGREPNSGVNTNTGFDAPKDYEGFSHSGARPEQFKHERKKPKVTTKERVNIGETYPSRAGQGTGDGGNPYDTRTQNKTEKGRAKQGEDRN